MNDILTDGLRFLCETDLEVWRAQSLLTKEPGTIAWLTTHCRAGDVVYDIGANIGCYTLYAARLVGQRGTVFAFEPHLGNAVALLRNIEANGYQNRVQVITAPLGAVDAIASFHYRSLRPGSSGSQLGHTTGEDGRLFMPAISELKSSHTLFRLLASGTIKAAQVVKVDVDGNELDILAGFGPWLAMHGGPRSMQIETRAINHVSVAEWMAERGYHHCGDHYTESGQQAITKGRDPLSIPRNAVFEVVS